MSRIKRLSLLVVMIASFCLCAFAGVLCLNNASATVETPVFAMEQGSSVRYNTSDPGLRFIVKMDEEIKNRAVKEDATLGFVISLTKYFDGVTDYINVSPKLNVESLVVPADKIYEKDGYYYANAVVGSMLEKNLGLEYSCVAYLKEGSTYTYATYSAETNSYSWQEVASSAYLLNEEFRSQTDYSIFGSFDLPILVDGSGDNSYESFVNAVENGVSFENMVVKFVDEAEGAELPAEFDGVAIEDGDFMTFEEVNGVNNGFSEIKGGNAGLTSYEISSEWAKNGKNSLKAVFTKENFTDTALAGSKWRGVLYVDTWSTNVNLGIANAYEGKDAVELWINASESCSVIFDVVPGNWSKVYHLAEGENKIIIKSNDTLSGSIDFSKGITAFSINVLTFNETVDQGNITLYLDAYKYINTSELPALDETPYVPEEGDFLSFDNVNGSNNGIDAILGGNSGLASYEISNDYAKNGVSSLKAVFNKATFDETALAGSKWRGVLFVGEFGKTLGLANAYEGKNAVELYINASEDCAVIFDVMKSENEGGNWSKVYQLSKGENKIVIKGSDTLSGTNDFTEGVEQLNVNVLSYDTVRKSGVIVLYLDAFKYIDANANQPAVEYVPVDGDFLTFENINGVNNGFEIVRGGNAGLVSYEISDEWAKNGVSSLKAVFNKSTFTETSLAGSTHRGMLYIDAYYDKLGLENAFVGKNAVEFYVYASEDCDIIIDVMKDPNYGGSWSKVYHLTQGENRIVLTSYDTLSGTNDFTEGSGALNINVLTYNATPDEGFITLYVDAYRYISVS